MGAARRLGHGALPQMWQPDPHRERRPRTLGSRPQRHQPLAPRDGRAPTVQQKNLGAPGRAEERTQLTAAAGASAEPRRLRRARTEDRGGRGGVRCSNCGRAIVPPEAWRQDSALGPVHDRPCPAEYSADELPRPRDLVKGLVRAETDRLLTTRQVAACSASGPRRSWGLALRADPRRVGRQRAPFSRRDRGGAARRRWRPRCGGGT